MDVKIIKMNILSGAVTVEVSRFLCLAVQSDVFSDCSY